jgi:SnoaL-like domain
MDEQRLEVVRRLWIDYREQGVDAALAHCHPELEFRAFEGGTFRGHQGVQDFFGAFEGEGGVTFAAAPYTFEPVGEGVIVAGHRRIHTPEGDDSQYMYFSHHVENGKVTRIAAWSTREEATRDVTPDG